ADQPAFGFHRPGFRLQLPRALDRLRRQLSVHGHRRAPRLGAEKPRPRGALSARLRQSLGFFYDPKNKEAAVRALAERTKSERDEAEKTYALYMKTQKTIPRDGGIDLQGARKVAENWKDFGLQKAPPPVDGAIDLSFLAEARK